MEEEDWYTATPETIAQQEASRCSSGLVGMLYDGCVEHWQRVSQERLWIMSESMGYIWQVKTCVAEME
jgi:hypothetical protein